MFFSSKNIIHRLVHVGNKRPLTTEIAGVLAKRLEVVFSISHMDHGHHEKLEQHFWQILEPGQSVSSNVVRITVGSSLSPFQDFKIPLW